jgi:hypothetical protein
VAVASAPAPEPPADEIALTVEPNPATGCATARWRQPRAGSVRVSVFDVRGREVLVISERPRQPGEQAAEVDASALAPGVYVVRVVSPGGTAAATFSVAR